MINSKLSDNYQHVKFNTYWFGIYSKLYAFWIISSSFVMSKINRLGNDGTCSLSKARWSHFLANKFLSETNFLTHKAIDTHQFVKSSDTLYIIGNGNSINNISGIEWKEIAKHDSIGLNFFFVHEFKPSLYMVEINQTEEMLAVMCDELFVEKNNVTTYVNIQHVLRNKNRAKSLSLDHQIKRNAYYYSPTYLLLPPDENKQIASYMMTKYYGRWLLNNSSNLDVAICFAYQKGYKNIKLVGVDLDNNRYFWDDQDGPHYNSELYSRTRAAFAKAQDAVKEKEGFKFKDDVHVTNDREHLKKYNKIPISEYLALVNKYIFHKKNIVLSVCNPKSKLRATIPFLPIIEK